MGFRKNHEFSKISRFSDSGSQDGTESWDPLGDGRRPPGGQQVSRGGAESGPGYPARPERARMSSTDTGDKLAIDRNSLQALKRRPEPAEALLQNMYRKYMDH